MNFLRFAVRMVKPRRVFYNALTLAALFTLAAGCGKPTPPPPGAGEVEPPTDVELGDVSNTPPATDQPTPNSPADEKPPGDESGAKRP